MNAININEQIAYYRKQRGLTQEDVARALGVTNQAVSKWESAQCCPDITLLPELACLFDVSVDKLLGRKPSASLGELCHMLKAHFSSLPEHSTFGQVYRIAALLHEAAATDGYKQQVPWQSRDYSTDDVAEWGLHGQKTEQYLLHTIRKIYSSEQYTASQAVAKAVASV